jgi:hypothetical protein
MPGIERKVLAHVRVPVGVVVSSRPHVQLRVDLVGVVDGRVVERIVLADVDPGRRGVVRRVVDDVVAGVVLGVVECAGCAVGSAEPERR